MNMLTAEKMPAHSDQFRVIDELVRLCSINGPLREYESREIRVNGLDGGKTYEILSGILAEPRPLDLRAEVSLSAGEGKAICCLKASGTVGIADIAYKSEHALVKVYPKVDIKELASMILWAYLPQMDPSVITLLDISESSLILPNIFLAVVEQLLLKLGMSLRKNYIIRHEELRSRIQGRPDLQLYMKRNLPKFRNERIPCSWWDLCQDNDFNRVLKIGLIKCNSFAKRVIGIEGILPYSARNASILEEKARRLLFHFEAVAEDYSSLFRRKRLRSVGNFKPYYDSLLTLEWLLKSLDFNLSGIEKWEPASISIVMHDVFEKCVLNFLDASSPQGFKMQKFEQTSQKIHYSKINDPLDQGDSGSKWIIPDGILVPQGNRDGGVIIDTKWKDAWNTSGDTMTNNLNHMLTRVSNSDIYQMAAYCVHQNINAKAAILVYPLDSAKNNIPIYNISGFKRGPDSPIPIFITGLPVKGDLQKALFGLSENVHQICAGN